MILNYGQTKKIKDLDLTLSELEFDIEQNIILFEKERLVKLKYIKEQQELIQELIQEQTTLSNEQQKLIDNLSTDQQELIQKIKETISNILKIEREKKKRTTRMSLKNNKRN